MNDAGRIGFVIRGAYDASATYDFLDVVYYDGASYVAKKLTTGNAPQESNDYWQVFAKSDTLTNISDATANFKTAEMRLNIQSGEDSKTLFGKIKKYFADLKDVAFSGSYNDLSDRPTIPSAVAVKGNAESAYRTGNVNLTPANIGAVETSNVMTTPEQINANTNPENVAGATAVKTMIGEINSNFAQKTARNIFTQRQDIEVNKGVNENSFTEAHLTLYADARDGKENRAQLGFHNGGVVGVAIYLDNDGRFKTISNSGKTDALAYASDLPNALWGGVEINSEVISQNLGCQWQSIGDVCTVYIQGYITIPVAYTEYMLASDLPHLKFGYEPIGLLQEQDSGRAYVIRITRDGKMYVRSDANPTDGAWVRGTIVYARNK